MDGQDFLRFFTWMDGGDWSRALLVESAGEDGGQFDLAAGREDLLDDYFGVGEVVVVPAVFQVSVEGFEGLETESGLHHLLDTGEGVGLG